MNQYAYADIPNLTTVRLLNLLPGNEGEALRGSLSFAELDDTPEYEAVSYVWGDPTPVEPIILGDERQFLLTSNLAKALRRLRLHEDSRTLWADQICVDQMNDSERSAQVKLMNRLYRSASRILVWLGDDADNDAKPAFSLVRVLEPMFGIKSVMQELNQAQVKLVEAYDEKSWRSVRVLLDLPWFRRIWIGQEIGTAAPGQLFWGNEEISWSQLASFCKFLGSLHLIHASFSLNYRNVRYLDHRFVRHSSWTRTSRNNFIYELHRARGREASETRDHVYAMLGHFSAEVEPESGPLLEASYQMSLRDLYIKLAHRSLELHNSLIILNVVQHVNGPSVIRDNMPSWIPQWHNKEYFYLLGFPNTVYRATPNISPTFSLDSTGHVLTVEGTQVDTIASCSEGLVPTDFREPEAARLIIEAIWKQTGSDQDINSKEQYSTGGSKLFAILQTLSGECFTTFVNYRPLNYDVCLADGTAWLFKTFAKNLDLDENFLKAAERGNWPSWEHSARNVCRGRKFVTTEKGYFALCPENARAGDIVCLLFGGPTAYCLRPLERSDDSKRFSLVGECYLQGFMHKEGMKLVNTGRLTKRNFELH